MLEIPVGKIREYEDVFSTLRRGVMEETGLRMSGAYSIILHTFLCEAEGEILLKTDETENIHWMSVSDVKRLVVAEPEKVFFMHINALRKYILQS